MMMSPVLEADQLLVLKTASENTHRSIYQVQTSAHSERLLIILYDWHVMVIL